MEQSSKKIGSKKHVLMIVALVVLVIGVLAAIAGTVFSSRADSAVIVIGDESNREVAKMLKDAMGSVRIVSDTKETNATTEILIGNTNRELSVKDSKGLREDDGWIRCYEDAIVIQGGTAEKLKSVANYFAENYVPSWQNGEGFPTDSDGNYYEFGKAALSRLAFDDTEIYEYSIVTKDGANTEDALLLQKSIKTASSYELPIISGEDLKEGQKAIIFGSSAVREAASKCEGLKEQEYLIQATKDSVYLCAWEDTREYIATYMFIGETMGYEIEQNEVENPLVENYEYNFKFTTKFDGTSGYEAMLTRVVHYPAQGEKGQWNVPQGACTDGEFIYIVMEDHVMTSYTCVIMKVDPKTWEVVEVSEPLPVDHGNSITYLLDQKQFLIANCQPDSTLISFVDAETLTYIRTQKMPFNASAYVWNQSRRNFAAMGQAKTMLILDENLNAMESYMGMASNYTMQGYTANDDYIFPITNAANQIHVCDWEGHWLDSVKIDVTTEMEYLIPMADGELYYTTFLRSGVDVCATIFYKTIYE